MKSCRLLNIILAVAVVVLALCLGLKKSTTASEPEGNPVLENILTRTSVRSYTDQTVDDGLIEQLIRAAMAAPSAGNKQPWRFVVIRNKATLQAISENFHTMKMAENAPLAIVVCGDMEATFPDDGLDYWVEDASAATENLLLAAHSLGLGAVWCGIYPMKERVAWLKAQLELPENIVPLNVIPIGYPAQTSAPKDKWKPENIRHETWGADMPW